MATTVWPSSSTRASISAAITGSSSMISTSVASSASMSRWASGDQAARRLRCRVVEDLGGFIDGEAFERGQQEGLAEPRRMRITGAGSIASPVLLGAVFQLGAGAAPDELEQLVERDLAGAAASSSASPAARA